MIKTKAGAKLRKIPKPAPLKLLESGVPGLDKVLGGGIPALSLNLIVGGPGAGKTTLAVQLLFANATPSRPGLFITLLGETSLKMLRYQRLFGYFDAKRVGKDVHFLNLSEDALQGDLEGMLALITDEVQRVKPQVVVVDSFRSLIRAQGQRIPTHELEDFVQRLAGQLTTWEITSFLIGEYPEAEFREPVFTVADSILWLSQESNRNSIVRRLQVVKARGMATMPGLHTIRISESGMQVFPRTQENHDRPRVRGNKRLSSGIPGLDQMMGGGIPAGDSLVLAGPTGTGKTTFAMRFISEGLHQGEAGVIAIFEEHPEIYLERAKAMEAQMREALAKNKLRIIYLRPLDLSVDETLDEIRSAVTAIGATRVVIDSISGFEMALAPAFRVDFRESLYRLISALTGLGITMFSTVEVMGDGDGIKLTGHQVSFLTDDILSQRYVEIEGHLRRALVVMKMRGSAHSCEFRTYELTAGGVQVGESLRDYDGIISGMPSRRPRVPPTAHPGLTEVEVAVLEILIRSGPLTRAETADMSGAPVAGIRRQLERLVELRYVSNKAGRFTAEVHPSGF